MKKLPNKNMVVITGATASGKSDLALSLADKLNGEIVNADAIQLYKYFEIGSAKPSLSQREMVRHHLIDVLEPEQQIDAAYYSKLADCAIQDVVVRDKLPLVVGGSSLYIKALLLGLAKLPGRNSKLRASLETLSNAELHKHLSEITPERAMKIHVNDRIRLIRAIEIGAKGLELLSQHAFQRVRYNAKILVIHYPRDTLKQRIKARSQAMMDRGLVEEVKMLIKLYGRDLTPLASIGYKEVAKQLDAQGTFSQEKVVQLVDEISTATWQLAKSQSTFWRTEPSKRGWIHLKKQDSSGKWEPEIFNLSFSELIEKLTFKEKTYDIQENEIEVIDIAPLVIGN
jgi:tRNA dimethylallyltransferase